jgi:hypothetical protein
MFDLQAMRVVKGRVELNTGPPPQYYTVINEYDGSPMTLGPKDFIIGYGVINASINTIGGSGILPLTPQTANTGPGQSPIVQFAINPVPPSYDVSDGNWHPVNPTGITVNTITDTLTNGAVDGSGMCINPGYGAIKVLLSTFCGLQSWVQLNQTGNSFTMEGGATTPGSINITLIILS